MTVRKILCCCESGLGSSIVVQMNTEETLRRLERTDIAVGHTTIASLADCDADLYVVGWDLEGAMLTIPESKKIILRNILDKHELEVKLKPFLDD